MNVIYKQCIHEVKIANKRFGSTQTKKGHKISLSFFLTFPDDEIRLDSKVSRGQKKSEYPKLIKLQTYMTFLDYRNF